MLAKVISSAVLGIDAYQVEVEADISPQIPTFKSLRVMRPFFTPISTS